MYWAHGGAGVQLVHADEHCAMLGDGLVSFNAGDGSRDILMLCGMISASHNSALGLFDLVREPLSKISRPTLACRPRLT